jgi:hypothetical protein
MKSKMLKIVFVLLLCGSALLLTSCKETDSVGEFQSIQELYKSCSGECGQQSTCEGQVVKVWGYLDQYNTFDKRQSNYETERFLIAEQLDSQGLGKGKYIEVFPPQAGNNASLFDKLKTAKTSSKILITGIAIGSDAPTNFTCDRLISLEIQGENSIEVK